MSPPAKFVLQSIRKRPPVVESCQSVPLLAGQDTATVG